MLHAERGDILYRHLRRLLAGASAVRLDAACREVWRRCLADRSPEAARWPAVLRQAYLVAVDHVARHPEPAPPPLDPALAAFGHATWMALSAPRTGLAHVDAEQAARWRHIGDEVLGAIRELPLPHRAAILLHHDLMLPMADIALVLGESPQAARALVGTALLHLRCRVGAGLAAANRG